ncbi:MAG: hypothetical protein AB1331_03040 [Bacillota bacterium]
MFGRRRPPLDPLNMTWEEKWAYIQAEKRRNWAIAIIVAMFIMVVGVGGYYLVHARAGTVAMSPYLVVQYTGGADGVVWVAEGKGQARARASADGRFVLINQRASGGDVLVLTGPDRELWRHGPTRGLFVESFVLDARGDRALVVWRTKRSHHVLVVTADGTVLMEQAWPSSPFFQLRLAANGTFLVGHENRQGGLVIVVSARGERVLEEVGVPVGRVWGSPYGTGFLYETTGDNPELVYCDQGGQTVWRRPVNGVVGEVAFNASGSHLAVLFWGGQAPGSRLEVLTSAGQVAWQAAGNYSDLFMSPDARQALVVRAGGVDLLGSDGRVRWSGDGIATIQGEPGGRRVMLALTAGGTTQIMPISFDRGGPDWSQPIPSDGRELMFWSDPRGVAVTDAAGAWLVTADGVIPVEAHPDLIFTNQLNSRFALHQEEVRLFLGSGERIILIDRYNWPSGGGTK